MAGGVPGSSTCAHHCSQSQHGSRYIILGEGVGLLVYLVAVVITVCATAAGVAASRAIAAAADKLGVLVVGAGSHGSLFGLDHGSACLGGDGLLKRDAAHQLRAVHLAAACPVHLDTLDVVGSEDGLLLGLLVDDALAHTAALHGDVEAAEVAEAEDVAVAEQLADAVHGLLDDGGDIACVIVASMAGNVLAQLVKVHHCTVLCLCVGLLRFGGILEILLGSLYKINLSHFNKMLIDN